MLRLFISINLPPDLLATLATTQNQLKRKLADSPLRWTQPEGIHITLKFLGDTEPGRIEEIVGALTRAVGPHQMFEIPVGGLGCFPNPAKTNVLWLGVHDPDERLRRLAADVDKATSGLGWQREHRPFTGHLTLARVQKQVTNQERRELGSCLPELGVPAKLGSISVDAIHLMRSELQRYGATYTSLADIPLTSSTTGAKRF